MQDPNSIAIKTYEKIAEKYANTYFEDLSDSPHIDYFLSLLPKKSLVLDVGCGPGQFTKYLMEKEFDTVGIDFSKRMISIAKENVPNGNFTDMDMRRLLFEDERFDGILCAYSLIHIHSNQIPNTLLEFKRVLKKSGYLFIITQKGEPDAIVDEPFLVSEKMFFNFFTKDRLASFLNDAGYLIDKQFEEKSADSLSASNTVIYTIASKQSV